VGVPLHSTMRIRAGAATAATMAACSSVPCSFPTKPDPHRRGRSSLPSSHLPRLPATKFCWFRSLSAAAAPSASRLRPRASVSASAAPSRDYEASTSCTNNWELLTCLPANLICSCLQQLAE